MSLDEDGDIRKAATKVELVMGEHKEGRMAGGQEDGQSGMGDSEDNEDVELTWDHIAGVHRILILDEAEAVHEFDLRDLSGAMGAEVRLNVGLGDLEGVQSQLGGPKSQESAWAQVYALRADRGATRSTR